MFYFNAIEYASPQPGTRLIITGAVHGNETCGTKAIQRIVNDINQGTLELVSGSVTFVPVTNPKAYAQNTRNGDRNLNRNLAPTTQPVHFEDHIANWLCPLFAKHDVLLDLHSFQAQGRPFVMVGPLNNNGTLEPFKHAASEEALAACLGVTRAVDGWLGTYAKGVERRIAAATSPELAKRLSLENDSRYGVGTTEYMRSVGGYALTLECGQHNDPEAPEVAYQAIRNTLAHLGILGISHASKPAKTQPIESIESLSLHTVIDKAHVEDKFVKAWSSFDALKQGELIGIRHNGEQVHAPTDGYIMFPNEKAQAYQEWFYLAQPSARF